MPRLPKGTTFAMGRGHHKYTAVVPLQGGTRRVHFGHRDYEHYKDRVPASMGGGRWSRKDHLDPQRRRNYRARHEGVRTSRGRRAIDVPYSPAWFSYHYLW